MDQNVILSFITQLMEEGVLLLAFCFMIGWVVKHSLDMIPNKFIPLITMLTGAVLGAIVPGIFADSSVIIMVIKGAIIGWASTGFNEFVRNCKQNKVE